MRRFLKGLYKKYLFKKNSILGNNVKVGAMANCISDSKDNIVIGDNCFIHGVLYSNSGGKITVGDHCFVNFSTFIGARKYIEIGSHVIISSNVRIMDNNNHPTSAKKRWSMCQNGFDTEEWSWKEAVYKPIKIDDNVWIGEYSAILKGVTIGKGSIIASHSVVTKDVPEYCIVAGNPAKIVKKIEAREE